MQPVTLLAVFVMVIAIQALVWAPFISKNSDEIAGFPLETTLENFYKLGSVETAKASIGRSLEAQEAFDLGLVTFTFDDIDWADDVRLMLEERASMSPDALTGMEANLRFPGPETMETKIFGRLTAWQNWIFQRPNATGQSGALKLYGSGQRPKFDPERT